MKYFVSYLITDPLPTGTILYQHGMDIVEFDKEITSMDDMYQLVKCLPISALGRPVTILNFKKLEV